MFVTKNFLRFQKRHFFLLRFVKLKKNLQINNNFMPFSLNSAKNAKNEVKKVYIPNMFPFHISRFLKLPRMDFASDQKKKTFYYLMLFLTREELCPH